jgi:hypothetical protein
MWFASRQELNINILQDIQNLWGPVAFFLHLVLGIQQHLVQGVLGVQQHLVQGVLGVQQHYAMWHLAFFSLGTGGTEGTTALRHVTLGTGGTEGTAALRHVTLGTGVLRVQQHYAMWHLTFFSLGTGGTEGTAALRRVTLDILFTWYWGHWGYSSTTPCDTIFFSLGTGGT